MVDGLDPNAGDVRHPGDYIEDEMIPYINKALSGETVLSLIHISLIVSLSVRMFRFVADIRTTSTWLTVYSHTRATSI